MAQAKSTRSLSRIRRQVRDVRDPPHRDSDEYVTDGREPDQRQPSAPSRIKSKRADRRHSGKKDHSQQDSDDRFAGDQARRQQRALLFDLKFLFAATLLRYSIDDPFDQAAHEDRRRSIERKIHSNGNQHRRAGSE
jgi:hypothetical protein